MLCKCTLPVDGYVVSKNFSTEKILLYIGLLTFQFIYILCSDPKWFQIQIIQNSILNWLSLHSPTPSDWSGYPVQHNPIVLCKNTWKVTNYLQVRLPPTTAQVPPLRQKPGIQIVPGEQRVGVRAGQRQLVSDGEQEQLHKSTWQRRPTNCGEHLHTSFLDVTSHSPARAHVPQ